MLKGEYYLDARMADYMSYSDKTSIGLTPVYLTLLAYSISIGGSYMGNQRYSTEFKDDAVRQFLDRGYSVAEVSQRLGVSIHSLRKWVKAVKPDKSEESAAELKEAKREILELRAELRRTEEERDILKKAAVDSTCQCNTLVHNLFWRIKFQCFSWPLI